MRYSGWKGKTLSLSERATLIQAVSTAVPIHVMQSFWLTENVCNRLDNFNREFLWSGDPSIRKLNLVGWQKVSRGKQDGGLGIRLARLNNQALLAKLSWKILVREPELWRNIVEAKYLKEVRPLMYKGKACDSVTWKGILRCMEFIKPHVRWKIGKGTSILFWFDNWLGNFRLCDFTPFIEEADLDLTLRDVMNENGDWDLGAIHTPVELNWTRLIEGKNSTLNDQEDKLIWNETVQGNFSCQSAYKSMYCVRMGAMRSVNLAWIWKLQCCNKIRYFIWLAHRERLATNMLRKIRKLTDSGACEICKNSEETTIHILRNCGIAANVWRTLLTGGERRIFDGFSDEVWMRKNLQSKEKICYIMPNIPWGIIFAATIWILWKKRNEKVFRGKFGRSFETICQVKQLAYDSWKAQSRGKGIDMKKWEKPKPGWLKLNFDGRVDATLNKGAIRGVLRDEKGAWLVGFKGKLQSPTILEAEVDAIRQGLMLAWDRRPQQICVETDSLEAHTLISTEGECNNSLKEKIEECRRLLRKSWTQEFHWIGRRKNGLAGALAKQGLNMDGDFCVLQSPPTKLSYLISSDVA